MSEGALRLIREIRSILAAEFHEPIVVNDRELQLSAGSTVCRVAVAETSTGQLLVFVLAFILGDVPATPALYEYVALHADDWVLGHFCVAHEERSNTVVLSIRHTLLGSSLQPADLVETVKALSQTANDLDDKLRMQFGGVRWVD